MLQRHFCHMYESSANPTSNKLISFRTFASKQNASCKMILRLLVVPTVMSMAGWSTTVLCIAQARLPSETTKYSLIGVSGGLQDGFPERNKMDYIDYDAATNTTKVIPAIYIGKSLIRGYKAFLDVMESGYRQYVDEPHQPLVNSNVFASGCHEHGNEYWFYLMDERQVLHVLMNEPRFLSITPDTGLIDLTMLRRNRRSIGFPQSLVDSYTSVHAFIEQYVHQTQSQQPPSELRMIDHQYVAVPLVTAVYYNPSSHVPSPILYTLTDGTEITNFPDSLAAWADVNSSDRTALYDAGCVPPMSSTSITTCTDDIRQAAQLSERRFWYGIRIAIRQEELQRLLRKKFWRNVIHPKGLWKNISHFVLRIQKRFNKKYTTATTDTLLPRPGDSGIPVFQCKTKTRFGAGPNTVRINRPFTLRQIHHLLAGMNYSIDVPNNRIIPISTNSSRNTITPSDEELKAEL